jgi:hypothetical protein
MLNVIGRLRPLWTRILTGIYVAPAQLLSHDVRLRVVMVLAPYAWIIIALLGTGMDAFSAG